MYEKLAFVLNYEEIEQIYLKEEENEAKRIKQLRKPEKSPFAAELGDFDAHKAFLKRFCIKQDDTLANLAQI